MLIINRIYEALFLSIFKNKSFDGKLELHTKKRKYVFNDRTRTATKKSKPAKIFIKKQSFFKRVILNGDTGFGEAYFLKEFETNDLKNLLLWFTNNEHNLPVIEKKKLIDSLYGVLRFFHNLDHKLNKNTRKGSKKNIKAHYDLSNDFYNLWLDETMTYSSGVFDKGKDLKKAQESKYAKVCKGINLIKEDHVLEVGSGWGGFSIYAATKYGCKITTITISRNQYNYVNDLIKKKKLDHLISVKFLDYRDIRGKYDKIVSIEMMEALGHEFVPVFINRLNSLLKKKGMIGLQFITIPKNRFKEYLQGEDYIRKYIFPGGEVLSYKQVKNEINKYHDLKIRKRFEIGLDYAKTLRLWRKGFVKNKNKVHGLGFDEIFFRKWYYYLVYCEVGFLAGVIGNSQVFIDKS